MHDFSEYMAKTTGIRGSALLALEALDIHSRALTLTTMEIKQTLQ